MVKMFADNAQRTAIGYPSDSRDIHYMDILVVTHLDKKSGHHKQRISQLNKKA